jgi:hypothetical protein
MVIPLRGGHQYRLLTRVGGIGGLSGYLADEVFGLAQLSAQIEYRHVLLNDMRINALNLAFLRSVGGVLFAGTATTSRCDSYRGWFGPDSWYGNVGYGLMGYFSVLGVTPQLLRIDASIPLVRRTSQVCLDRVFPAFLAERQGAEDAQVLLPPFNINVVFQQSF